MQTSYLQEESRKLLGTGHEAGTPRCMRLKSPGSRGVGRPSVPLCPPLPPGRTQALHFWQERCGSGAPTSVCCQKARDVNLSHFGDGNFDSLVSLV